MVDSAYLLLCVADSVLNLVFLLGGLFLAQAARYASAARPVVLLFTGTWLVFAGGALKALSMVLPALGMMTGPAVGDAQFVLMALGFGAMLVAVVLLTTAELLPEAATVASGQWAPAI